MNPTSQSPPDYSWATYIDYMEGVGSDVVTLPSTQPPAPPAAERKEPALRGILVSLATALAALFLSEAPLWPFTLSGNRHLFEPVMLAIVLGMILGNVWSLPKSLQPGIKFSVKQILPLGIVLLGARLDFFVMQRVGLAGLVLAVVEIVGALLLLALLVRLLKLPGKLGTLLGVGTAICGGTAIVATAPVIQAEDEDVVMGVATVTLLGLIAMFSLPVIGHALELGEKAFGVWAGLAIHQTPQVVAAGFAYGAEAGETATIVKLARVCLLAPVVFVIGLLYARQQAAAGGTGKPARLNCLHLFPKFVFGFLGLAVLQTLGLLPQLTFASSILPGPGTHSYGVGALAEQASKICIVVSMAAVGLETKFSVMKQTGLKPLGAAFVAIVVLAAAMLGLIRMLAIYR